MYALVFALLLFGPHLTRSYLRLILLLNAPTQLTCMHVPSPLVIWASLNWFIHLFALMHTLPAPMHALVFAHLLFGPHLVWLRILLLNAPPPAHMCVRPLLCGPHLVGLLFALVHPLYCRLNGISVHTRTTSQHLYPCHLGCLHHSHHHSCQIGCCNNCDLASFQLLCSCFPPYVC